MAEIHDIATRIRSDRKARVASMAKGAIAYLDKAQQEMAASMEDAERRKVIVEQLELVLRKAYAVLGETATEELIPWVQSLAKLQKEQKP